MYFNIKERKDHLVGPQRTIKYCYRVASMTSGGKVPPSLYVKRGPGGKL